MTAAVSYHDRPEWSYSSMKMILDSGIDYAVGARLGMTEPIGSSAIDMGQLIHQLVLGGDEKFAVSPYESFRTKDAREWRDLKVSQGYIVVPVSVSVEAERIAERIKKHPHVQNHLLHPDAKREQEMFAKTAEGIELRGKADSIVLNKQAAIITDLKTTAQFDKFAKNAYWSHYDLQSATYTLIGANHLKIQPELINYKFVVAETVKPHRVQVFHASLEFVEAGERKLRTCIDSIVDYGDNIPNFLLEEEVILGDWSL